MNISKILFVAAFIALFTAEQASAQLLREIKNRAIERSKDIIVEKSANKAAEKTGEAMDKLLNPDFSKLANPMGKKVDMSNLPDEYYFSYLYRLKMNTSEGDIEFDYYLNPTESYMAAKMNMGMDMTMVFDEGNNVIITMVNGMPIATEMDPDESLNEDELSLLNDYTITELPNRRFLEYDCIGRQMENEDYKFIVYIAPDVEAGFGNVFKTELANMPPAMQATAKEYENGLMMYMEMHDKTNNKKKNTSGSMECVAFEPAELVIRTKQ
jgi:hypothetical protein